MGVHRNGLPRRPFATKNHSPSRRFIWPPGVTSNEVDSPHLATKRAPAKGQIERHTLDNVSPESSFLEMLDQLNEELQSAGREPVAFDSDCREGICGSCSMVINGRPHGPWKGTTTCQLHMRAFKDGDEIHIEPFA